MHTTMQLLQPLRPRTQVHPSVARLAAAYTAYQYGAPWGWFMSVQIRDDWRARTRARYPRLDPQRIEAAIRQAERALAAAHGYPVR